MRATSGLKPASGHPAGTARLPVSLTGDSEPVRRLREALDAAAPARAPVLLAAEPGFDLPALAAYLHARGRPGEPFVAIDCGAAGAGEIQERLFGPPGRRAGRELECLARGSAMVRAGRGTLFLENIGELPASAQRRLVRLLRDGEAHVAPRQQPVPLGFRLVASTERDLDSDAREGGFRADLLRRFRTGLVAIPPLRQRPGDLGAIVERLADELGEPGRTFTQAAVTVLSALPWPGNVEELASVLSATLAAAGPLITQEDVLAHVPIDGAFTRPVLTASLREARRRFERDYIAAVLDRHQWRMSDAAEALGIERANLYRKTRQLGISRLPKAQVS